jgi:hypothetical protein
MCHEQLDARKMSHVVVRDVGSAQKASMEQPRVSIARTFRHSSVKYFEWLGMISRSIFRRARTVREAHCGYLTWLCCHSKEQQHERRLKTTTSRQKSSSQSVYVFLFLLSFHRNLYPGTSFEHNEVYCACERLSLVASSQHRKLA